MDNKAQAWGFDLIIASIIFVVAIISFYLYTINYSPEKEDMAQILSYEGTLIAESILSEGFPENWDSSTVSRIGLLSQNKINETKLKQFSDLAQSDYAKTKSLFKIQNNYFITFSEEIIISEEQISIIGAQTENPTNLIKTERIIPYENKILTISIQTWE